LAGGLSAALLPGADLPVEPTANPTAPAGVTLVNIHLKQALPEEVFGELAKQGGVKIAAMGSLWDQDSLQTPMDVDFTNKPFWPAMKEACGLWSISIQSNRMGRDNGRKITLVRRGTRINAGKTQPRPSCQSNGCLIEAVSFNRNQNLSYDNPDAAQDSCNLNLMVYLDPALHVRNFNSNVSAEQAMDDQGNSMLAAKNNSNVFYGGMSEPGLIHSFSVPLKFPDNAGKKIAAFKCTLTLRAADKMEALSIDKPLAAAEASKDFAGTTITFQSLKKSEARKGYELAVNVASDSDLAQNNGVWELLQTAQLLDDKGHAFRYSGGNGGGGGGNDDYTVYYSTMRGDDATQGEPAKWIIELPTQVHVVKVPVEFKDLPLP